MTNKILDRLILNGIGGMLLILGVRGYDIGNLAHWKYFLVIFFAVIIFFVSANISDNKEQRKRKLLHNKSEETSIKD